jgi:4-hydroxyacetophenone monooxygenase
MTRTATIPGTDDDLRAALRDVNLPNLLMVMVQLSGDTRWMSARYVPQPIVAPEGSMFADDSGGYADDVAAEIRAGALAILRKVRDGQLALPEVPSLETFNTMLTFSVAEPVPRDYAAMLLEETGLVDRDAQWRKALAQARNKQRRALDDFHIVIIGAGMSGLGMAAKLKQAGIAFTVIEKNAAVGGTWYENTYPDCGVDTPNHFYSYSFERNPDWSGYFSKRDELYAYFERCTDDFKVRDHIRLGTEVVSTQYDGPSRTWAVHIKRNDGQEETLTANVVVSAVGQLNRPHVPEIDGLSGFKGPLFHSARWNHDVDLAGKRVAVIGSGCSAVQFLPKTVDRAGRVLVFQRTPHWVSPARDYYRPVEAGLKWALNHIPFYAEWHRARMIWSFADRTWPAVNADPAWTHPERAMNEQSDVMRAALTEYIRTELGERQELFEKCLPDYPVWGKRLIVDNSWYRTLARDTVDLITTGIRRITATGVETVDGTLHEVDVIILGTGFRSNLFLWPMEVRGRSGAPLAAQWGDYPRAYKGIAVPDFPNLFCLYGPNTNIVHGGSIIYQVECQIHYVMQCLAAMLNQGIATMEVKRDVNDDYNEEVQAISAKLAWGHPGVQSWYKNSQGRVVNNSPFSLHHYWEVTHDLALSDYELEFADPGGQAVA